MSVSSLGDSAWSPLVGDSGEEEEEEEEEEEATSFLVA